MVIAVLGATGQLGSELLAVWGEDAVGLSRDRLDLQDPKTVDAVLDEVEPEVVVNAAAYNQVDRAESEPATAMAVNALGPRQLARSCASRGIRLVHISSDFVFGADPNRREPYTESDETGPLGAYGVSKLGGELYVRSGCPDHLVVRTCGLYGHGARRRQGGGNFVETMLRLAEAGGPVRVVSDQWCTPTSTTVLAAAIDALLGAGCRGLYHATCAGSTNWWEFAGEIFKRSDAEVDLEAITSREFGAEARRPQYSVLDCGRLVRDTGYTPPGWQFALAEYLDTREPVPE
ncbi:MAG TPA: dTDP-4-dehydrorhamnose reductase [Planctomycetaceae bacterium]|nr:dTDP-4-dehydrorhamnose reductase [Planctomycetaceae bacterium]